MTVGGVSGHSLIVSTASAGVTVTGTACRIELRLADAISWTKWARGQGFTQMVAEADSNSPTHRFRRVNTRQYWLSLRHLGRRVARCPSVLARC
jgi:hypothetical protein